MSEINFGECGLCLQAPCTCNDPGPEQETRGLSPTCPACGATIYEGDFRMEDGDEEEVTCDGCGTTYVVRLVVSRDYYSRLAAIVRPGAGKEGERG